MCVARARGLHRWEEGVLVVSIDRVVPALHLAADWTMGYVGSQALVPCDV